MPFLQEPTSDILTGRDSLVACGIYYYLWIHAIPKWRGYRIRHETVALEGGEVTHRLVKVDLDKLAEWDAKHDAGGDELGQGVSSDSATSSLVESNVKPKETA